VEYISCLFLSHKDDEMQKYGKKRILLGKMGLDAHDNGIVIVAKWLLDAGFEVVYAGLYNSPESLIQTAIQEGVDAVGCSFLGGEHLFYTRRLTDLMHEKHINKTKLILGGVIPPEDIDELKRLGVACIFTPGTLRDTIIEALNNLFNEPE
jgi:methylmalonyl-CoA mutase C-terminal domain/subunit